jgi:acyl-CoA synthetase (AMP-forming)/AMP-acid ligase II
MAENLLKWRLLCATRKVSICRPARKATCTHVVRSPFVGYVQGRRFTEQFFATDGWFNTGDRARLDANGYVRIIGRSKDIIIRGGENVPVKEIEDLMLRHSKVLSVALVGVPHVRFGEVSCACVIPEPGEDFTLDELRAFLAELQVTQQFWPEQLELMDEFPTTASGKVQKFRLREMVGSLQPAPVRA